MANKILKIILPLALISILVIIGVVVWSRQNQISPVTTDSEVKNDNWETYVSETHRFSIKHPKDIQIRQVEGDNIINFTKIGPTQTENTELYDGISLSFRSISIPQNTNFRQYVDNQYNEIKSHPIIDRIDPIVPVSIANYQGYKFFVQSIGEFTYIYLPQKDNRALEIIDATVDPTNRGFKQTVDEMLSTLNISN